MGSFFYVIFLTINKRTTLSYMKDINFANLKNDLNNLK